MPFNGVKIEISVGEALDRLSILSIKKERLIDPDKQQQVNEEYNRLIKSLEGHLGDSLPITQSDTYKELKQVNERLWEIEDKIRELDKEIFQGDNSLANIRQGLIMCAEKFSSGKEGGDTVGDAFAPDFQWMQCARSVYFLNDTRYMLKSKFNNDFHQEPIEVKSHV
tara:strand:+ start:2953 stop:3453 length:501 start_codon:yes stop_codon:yes gene_type:complete